jgi:hypothetical protein
VDAWIIAAVVLFAACLALAAARRRARRRAEQLRARARARRRRAPLVSANVRPQSDRKPDIWRDEREAAARE